MNECYYFIVTKKKTIKLSSNSICKEAKREATKKVLKSIKKLTGVDIIKVTISVINNKNMFNAGKYKINSKVMTIQENGKFRSDKMESRGGHVFSEKKVSLKQLKKFAKDVITRKIEPQFGAVIMI